ncbi:MAG: hypothetical protein IKG35_00625 [Erysipelotrichaceae bacterium]|nr:hypothetical protein [Erysipelotrichaceae bacterium]
MKSRRKMVITFLWNTILVIAISIYYCFFDISHFKRQEQMFVVESNNNLAIVVYRNNGGATVDYSLLCTVKNTETNQEWNLFWDYPYYKPEIKWINDNTVMINSNLLNVYLDRYDYRREK